ncbi:hypothetical protein FRC17_002492 [Serendipita sp. 399]|nr:hypothetical protein FRC17_002492 [Serendipita sp. 399]
MPQLGFARLKAKAKSKALERWQENPIYIELNQIKKAVPNASLAYLFAETVRRMIETRRQSQDLDQIKDIVRDVKERVGAVNGDFEQCRDSLQDAMTRLRGLLDSKKSVKLLSEAVSADEEDENRRQNVQLDSLASPDADGKVQIFFMGDPDREPYLLPQGPLMTTYNDIIWHFYFNKIVEAPELWIRREDRKVQPFTASGRHWVIVTGENTIDETVLDIVEMASVPRCYIVALVDNGEREIPFPIGVPIFGLEPCCEEACGSLRTHLESSWKVRVEHARLFRKQEFGSVLDALLNSINFPPRRNELYLKVVQRTEEGASDAAATNEAPEQ